MLFYFFSWDILHNWVYPITIESGSFYKNNYMFMGNHIFRKTNSTLSRYILSKNRYFLLTSDIKLYKMDIVIYNTNHNDFLDLAH